MIISMFPERLQLKPLNS